MNQEFFEEYLSTAGWKYRLSESIIEVEYKGQNIECLILIQQDDQGTSFAIYPFLEEVNQDCVAQLNESLLVLNSRINFVKFCLSEDSKVMLLLESMVLDLSYDDFHNRLNYIALVADEFHPIIKMIASDPDFKIPSNSHE